MPRFRPAYLIHGDDHGRIAERRAKLRAMAERESGAGGVEVFEGEACTADAIAAALTAMTFAMGRRFVVADGVERWKDSDVAPVADALASIDPETLTVTFFAREEGRYRVPKPLVDAVTKIGGVVDAEQMLKPWELPKWVVAQAKTLGLTLDNAAAKALVARVGDRQQRLLRELETLALAHEPGARLGEEEVSEEAATSAERKLWTLADAIVAGDERAAVRALVELRGQGERVPGLIYGIVRRLRDAHGVALALAAGQSPSQVKKELRLPSRAADRLIADVRKRDVDYFERALEAMADLELLSRGGGELRDDTEALRALTSLTG